MMGSTSNALDKGGDNFKKLYNASDVTQRNRNGQTKSGLYFNMYSALTIGILLTGINFPILIFVSSITWLIKDWLILQ